MSENIYNLLNLNSNVSIQELTTAFNTKINQIQNLLIEDVDKNILINYYSKLFRKAENYYYLNNNLFNNQNTQNMFNNQNTQTIFNDFNNNLQNSFYQAQSYSYSSVLNPDGTQNVYERNQANINGRINDNINQYRVDQNGNKIPNRIN